MFPPPPRPQSPHEHDSPPVPPPPPPVDREPPWDDGHDDDPLPEEGLRTRVRRLEDRVRVLERKLAASMLHSEGFWARAATVWGHFMAFYLLIILPFLLLALCAGAFTGPGGGVGNVNPAPR